MVAALPAADLTDGQGALAQQRRPPQRTCVGCRGRGDRSVLLRLVVQEVDGSRVVVLDLRRRMPGRGLWLHPDEHCLDLAVRRSALARALRPRGPADTTTVVQALRSVLQDGARPLRPRAGRGDTTPGPTDGPSATTGSGQNADDHTMSTQR